MAGSSVQLADADCTKLHIEIFIKIYLDYSLYSLIAYQLQGFDVKVSKSFLLI